MKISLLHKARITGAQFMYSHCLVFSRSANVYEGSAGIMIQHLLSLSLSPSPSQCVFVSVCLSLCVHFMEEK